MTADNTMREDPPPGGAGTGTQETASGPRRPVPGPGAPERRVDVVLLSLNRVEDTLAALDSVLCQQQVAVSVCILDQGSHDPRLAELGQRAARDGRIRIRYLSANVGAAAGRNMAAALGDAPYLVCIDNDAELRDTDALARLCDHFERNPGVGALSFRILNKASGRDDLTTWDHPRALLAQADRSFAAARFSACGYAMRRALHEQVGGYDADFFFGVEEIDLAYRMLATGATILYVPDVVVLHKSSPEMRVTWKGRRYYYIVRNSLYFQFKFGTPLPQLALSALAWMVKGGFNGMGIAPVRAVLDALRMSLRHGIRRRGRGPYHLSPPVRAYIEACEMRAREDFVTKVRKQFVKLGGHSVSTGT